ncbi:hypothetical protein [Thermoleophilum album]|uniref:Uncharacterized protein n=1 Tax=Thermoleophilum album TaxID=29539 RepID=A0A1H6FZM5_THEAL|nr:hypothetical protein [Thermoleophilum album]SEH16257.1 hypothetical protein SAMN02745716_2128 [Thermoleophilum album]
MTDDRGHRAKRALLRVAYWLAAIAIALVLVAALIYFLESRDDSTLDTGSAVDSRASITVRSTD